MNTPKPPTFIGLLLIAIGLGLMYAGIRGWSGAPKLVLTPVVPVVPVAH